MYKHKSERTFVKAYVQSFVGFCKLFNAKDIEDFLPLFIDFILLKFPKPKVKLLLETVTNEGPNQKCITTALLDIKRDHKNRSKHSLSRLYEENEAFKIICNHIRDHLPEDLNDRDKEAIQKVVKW